MTYNDISSIGELSLILILFILLRIESYVITPFLSSLSFDKEIGYVEQLFKERSNITNIGIIKKRLILSNGYSRINGPIRV